MNLLKLAIDDIGELIEATVREQDAIAAGEAPDEFVISDDQAEEVAQRLTTIEDIALRGAVETLVAAARARRHAQRAAVILAIIREHAVLPKAAGARKKLQDAAATALDAINCSVVEAGQ